MGKSILTRPATKVCKAGLNRRDQNYVKRRAGEGATPEAVAHELQASVSLVERFWPLLTATIPAEAPETPITPKPPSNRRKRKVKESDDETVAG